MPMMSQSEVYRRASGASRQPRSRLIIGRTIEAINATNLNVLKFASRVAEMYNAAVPAAERTIEFYDAAGTIKSLLRAEKRNGCIVDRLIKGVVRFPCDLEESWINALPDLHRANLVRELASRYGLSGARLPTTEPSQSIVSLADVLRDAGEVARTLAPACADGQITIDDAPHVAAALVEIDRGLSDLLTLKAQLGEALIRQGASVASLRAVK